MLLQSVPNPNYMNGTMLLEPWEEDRFGLNDDFPKGPNLDMGQIGGTGLDAEGMGTTGSLGVSFAAPLTRGGFAGEIFDSAPMPTGNWRNAPTPVMLGTASSVGNYHDISYSGDPDFPISGMPAGMVKGTPEYIAESSRQIIAFQALVNSAEKRYHMNLLILAAVAGLAFYLVTKSRKKSEKTVQQDADDARSSNPRLRRFNRRWARRSNRR